MSQIGPGYIRIVAGGEEVARYAFTGAEFSTERAVMLGDLYLKDVWRFAAVGQGFDGGLDALLKNFGGEVAEEEPRRRTAGRRARLSRRPPGGAPASGAPRRARPRRPPPSPLPATPPQQRAARTGVRARSRRARRPRNGRTAASARGARPSPPRSRRDPPCRPARRTVPARCRRPAAAPSGPAGPAAAVRPGAGSGPAAARPCSVRPAARPAATVVGAARSVRPAAAADSRAAGLQAALQKYREAPTGQRWTPQNPRLMRADLGQSAASPYSPARAAWCSTRARSTSATRAPASQAGSSATPPARRCS